jgi:hypothetical protein
MAERLRTRIARRLGIWRLWVEDHFAAYIALSSSILLLTSFWIAREVASNALEAGYDNRLISLEQCERGNLSRESLLRNTLDTAQGSEERAKAWRDLIEGQSALLGPAITAFAQEQARANHAEAARLRMNARAFADAQADISLHPNGTTLERAEVACNKVHPLPAEYGDQLPTPELPVTKED